MSMGLAGCGSLKPRRINLWKEQAYFTPRPRGTMPMTDLGATGIKISKFGFGSHIRKDIISKSYEYQREYMIREANDLGINVSDERIKLFIFRDFLIVRRKSIPLFELK